MITTWSFSRLKDYERCPHTQQLRLNNAPKPPFEINRGTEIHESTEKYIRGELADRQAERYEKQIHRSLHLVKPLAEAYQDGAKITLEEEWGFTENWEPCAWDSPDIWLRVQCDAVEHHSETLQIIDWKTGRSYGNELNHIQQLQLYAIAGFMRYPEIETVTVEDRYLDEGRVLGRTYARDEKFETLFIKWNERAQKMLTDTAFLPKPNRTNCRFCDYGLNKGTGVCEYAVPAGIAP
jgi:CRISPR/Cas system-associated exonuclease Cas4 (RecB family)